MQDLISYSNIFNRKIVLEIRYGIISDILDNRGKIADALLKAKVIKSENWGFADNGVEVYNFNEKKSHFIRVDINVIRYIDEHFNSNQEYWNNFTKYYNTIESIINKPDQKFVRIGCRIQGVYKKDSLKFKEILSTLLKKFPDTFLYKDFNQTDMRFVLNYDNGKYEFGPVKENDIWVKETFIRPDKKLSEGFGLDTDNFTLNVGSLNTEGLHEIKKVLEASLAVESFLYNNLLL